MLERKELIDFIEQIKNFEGTEREEDALLENLENNKEQVIKKFGLKAVSDIENRVVSNRFKRQMPLIVKI